LTTKNSFKEETFPTKQTTVPLIHSIPEVPSVDNPDQDMDDEDEELVHRNLATHSDLEEEEARFPVEYDEDDFSVKTNERLVDAESLNQ